MKEARRSAKAQAWVLVLLMVATACAPLVAQAAYEGPGWDTPEGPVEVYLEGLKEQDISKMISAYAVETFIDNYDLAAQVARIAVYNLSMVPRLPNTNQLTRDINVETRKNQIVQAVIWQITSVAMPEQDFAQPTTFSTDNREQEVVEFVDGLDEAYGAVDFSTLRIVGFR